MEKREENKKLNLKKIILAIALIAFSVLFIINIGIYLKNRETKKEYEKLAERVTQNVGTDSEADAEAPYVSPIDFASLKMDNPDTIGWIRVPDTNIDYPIVQGTDNDFYLKHDFYGEKNVAGAIYLDFESEKDFISRNNILYGHNMKNGSMFKDVVRYKDPEYFKSHQFFSIYTPSREIHLKAVACYYGAADDNVAVRKTRFKSQENFDEWVKAILAPCSYKEDVLYPARNMYSLVTCSYEVNNARTFLFAVEVDEDGNELGMDNEYARLMEELVIRQVKRLMETQEQTEEQTDK